MRRVILPCLLLIASLSWAGEARIYAQRMTAAGAKAGSAFQIHSAAATPADHPRVAFYDDRYLVVWQSWNGSDYDVLAARVQMDGTVLDTTPLQIDVGARTQGMPDVAADTGGFMVVWHAYDGTDIFPSLFARRVDADGTLHTPIQFGDSNTIGSHPRIAWDGSKHLVAYQALTSLTLAEPRLRWNTLTTTPVASSAISSYILPNNGATYHTLVPAVGGGWTIIASGDPANPWQRTTGRTYAVSILADGSINPAGYVSAGQDVQYFPTADLLDYQSASGTPWPWGGTAAATDASYIIAVWSRYDRGILAAGDMTNGDLRAARVDAWDPVETQGGTAISTNSGYSEHWPALAGDGAGSLLLAYEKAGWTSGTFGQTTLESRMLTVDGSGITPGSEVQIRDASTGGRRTHTAIAYGDDGGGTTGYLVVWTEGWWGVQ